MFKAFNLVVGFSTENNYILTKFIMQRSGFLARFSLVKWECRKNWTISWNPLTSKTAVRKFTSLKSEKLDQSR